jgi:hypothetical protein
MTELAGEEGKKDGFRLKIPVAEVELEIPVERIEEFRNRIREAMDVKIDEFVPSQSNTELEVYNRQAGEKRLGTRSSSTKEDYILARLNRESPRLLAYEERNENERVTSIPANDGLTITMLQNSLPDGEYSKSFIISFLDVDESRYDVIFSEDGKNVTVSGDIQKIFPFESGEELLAKIEEKIKSCEIPPSRSRDEILKEWMKKNPEKARKLLYNILRNLDKFIEKNPLEVAELVWVMSKISH